ncbi:hypothetical protein DID88_004728 [Monilinia fructigena]|uniref:Uncharacterized protein n=1 Tax=Monilinia fructigena TaxID=38457 RepID=A0A395IRF3_9HELO|nr:hypothetical protein DID88_004728 [Monilinia fructigena]
MYNSKATTGISMLIIQHSLPLTTHLRENSFRACLPTIMATSSTSTVDDYFQLYDIRVEVVCPPSAKILCGAKEGDHFTLEGEMLYLPPGQGISIYSLSSVLPFLAAKQRFTHANDWIATDGLIACPDPNCGSQLKITRTGLRTFRHGETTIVGLKGNI